MKKVIMATVIAVCIALCAAVWPQGQTVEETPTPTPTPAVCAPEATVAEPKTEDETALPTEKEKDLAPQTDSLPEFSPEPEPMTIETSATPETQPTRKPESAHEPTPEPTPEPSAAPTAIEPQSGDMVYVEGFGWIESQGTNRVDYAEDIYENGNKIGIMG